FTIAVFGTDGSRICSHPNGIRPDGRAWLVGRARRAGTPPPQLASRSREIENNPIAASFAMRCRRGSLLRNSANTKAVPGSDSHAASNILHLWRLATGAVVVMVRVKG